MTIVHVETNILNKVPESFDTISPEVFKLYPKFAATKNNFKSKQLKIRISTGTPVPGPVQK